MELFFIYSLTAKNTVGLSLKMDLVCLSMITKTKQIDLLLEPNVIEATCPREITLSVCLNPSYLGLHNINTELEESSVSSVL